VFVRTKQEVIQVTEEQMDVQNFQQKKKKKKKKKK
jgi:hypothetical protein